MCGITGFLDYNKQLYKADLENSLKTLKHRGPDNDFCHFEETKNYNIGMANNRLAIIDVHTTPPLVSKCGFYTLIFNGTIYNHDSLRLELESLGVQFRSKSDTEVLLEAYINWKEQLFDKIDGVFAFAVLDKNKNKLFIARDGIGVKPLFICKNDDFFAFASEIRAITSYPKFKKKINKKALSNYLRLGYFYNKETIFEDIYRINHGTFIQSTLTIEL